MDAVSALSDDPYEEADKMGLSCVEPDLNELFIDIDTEEDYAHYRAMRTLLEPYYKFVSETISASRTDGHVHIRLRLGEHVTAMERIAWQAALGSDRKRELLSILRVVLNLQRPPTVFFETPPTTEEFAGAENDMPF
jgi:hypothetical protein